MNIEDLFDILSTHLDGSTTIDQLADILSDNGIDITDLSGNDVDTLFDMYMTAQSSGGSIGSDSLQGGDVSFGAAGNCWWCHGSGVVWSGGKNVPCPRCGGSGIGSV